MKSKSISFLSVAIFGLLGLAFNATSAKADWLFVSNEKDDTVSVIDTTSRKVINTIKVGERPRGVTLSQDFKNLYVCASDADTIQVIDIATGKVIHDLPSGEDPETFALHPDGKHLYVANEDDALATVVDIESRKAIAEIDVGVEPEGMADLVRADPWYGFVNAAGNILQRCSVFDEHRRAEVNTVHG